MPGFEPNLASLKDWQPHQKSNGPCLCAHDLRDRWNDCSMWAGRRSNPSLLVFSQALNHLSYQPGFVFRSLPAAKEEARCPLRDTGLLRACGGLGRCHERRGYEDSSLRKPVFPELPAKCCRIWGRTGCAAKTFAGMANRLVSLCLQSDISCENIIIRKTFEVASS